jgi:uncharacterized membrane protein YcaP (DUF421 family)
MNQQDFQTWDWQRIFIGEVPTGFLVEVIIRVAFIYLLLIVSMRFFGKKMASQFTRNEMAALVSLAAAVGVPILTPDRGLVPALVICIVIVAISRLVTYFSLRSEKVESMALGVVETLVEDGVLNRKTMEGTGLSRERVFAQLRSYELIHLGQVGKLFFEANGQFTLVKAQKERPGLTIIPGSDVEFTHQLSKSREVVCGHCGRINSTKNNDSQCPSCGHREWVQAVTSEEKIPDKVPVGQQ